jgi:hypothetical protein
VAAAHPHSLATKTLDQKPRELPVLKLSHLSRMTDSTGIFQHAIFSIPNFSEGYCTDDNARAFILAVLLSELGQEPERVRTLATTYARARSDLRWYEQAQRAFDWFIGWNDLGLELCSPKTGGCRDGLHVDRVNRNQGAESTLAFLLSLGEMRLAQNMLTSFRDPLAV